VNQSGRAAEDPDLGAMTANGATTSHAAVAVDEPSATKTTHRIPDVASWPPARRNLWLLVAVAVCFAVFELLIIGLRYEYTSDEAIYLSQLNPLVPNYDWAAWRAWGMPVLGAPVAVTDAPLSIVRLYFVLLSSGGLFLAFRPWLGLSKRPLVPIAAAVFASTAVAVYNGSLALPNFYSALAAIAATGYFMACRRGVDGYRRSVVGLAAAVALAALVRPSDSLWLVAPLGLVWLALYVWRRRAIVVAIVVGQIIGWAPWVIESFARFGGPLSRLRLSAASLGGTHVYPDLSLVRVYVRLWSSGDVAAVSLNVPPKLRGGAATIATHHLSAISVVATIWWAAAAGAIILAILGVVLARWDTEGIGRLVLIPLLVGLSVGFPYLFMMRYAQLRFLLPAVGLLALPIAYGVLQLGSLRIPPLRALGPTLAVALVLALIGIQMANAPQYSSPVSRSNAFYSSIVQQLRDEGISGPCAVGGDGSFSVAYQVGCHSLNAIRPASVEPASVTSARSRGESVAIVLKTAPRAGTFLDQWRSILVQIPGSTKHGHVYLAPK
jgi:hypothetical protein